MMKLFFGFLFFISITLVYSQLFVPYEYVPHFPVQSNFQERHFEYVIDLCDTSVYDNCLFQVTYNMPFVSYSVPSGKYVNFSITGNGDDCSKVHCQNNGADPFSCKFLYDSSFGDKLYFISDVGPTSELDFTFNMRIVCNAFQNQLSMNENNKKIRQSSCPTNPRPTNSIIRFDDIGSVKTSSDEKDFIQYRINTCNSTGFSDIDFSLQGADDISAFSTYFCDKYPCFASDTNSDNSGSGVNKVILKKVPNGNFYFAIAGWGKYQGLNRYRFSIDNK